MNIRNTLYCAAGWLLLLALTACTKDYEGLNTDDPVAVRFIADIAPATRASGTTWTGGDRIGVTDIGNDTRYGNVPFILKNGKFEAEEKVIYIEDTETHTFRAYYPYNEEGGIVTATTDATAQQNQPAIDFLFASGATGDKDSPVVSFTDKTDKGGADNSFHHSMSLVQFTFKAGDGISFTQAGPEGYTLGGLKHEGTFDTATGIASATAAQSSPISMQLGGSTSSQLILFPQDVGSLDLSVSHNGQNYTGTFTVPGDVVEAGKRYIYTVRVGRTGLTLEGCTIGGWEPGNGESGPAEESDYSILPDGSYMVYNADGLLEWNRAVQNDMTLNCILARDIDLTGKEWIMVGTSGNRYSGTFDGGGHTVTGLVIDKPGVENVALFGYIEGGTVKDLKLAGLKLNGYKCVAGIAGFIYSGTTISGCSVSGEITGYSSVGGLAGGGTGGAIDNCSSEGSVIASQNYVGGIVGNCLSIDLSECRSSADIQGKGGVGGIAGYRNQGILTACCSSGSVTATVSDGPQGESYAGGIVGQNDGLPIVACYSTGDVSAQGRLVGGIAGFNVDEIIACYHSGAVNGTGEAVGGILGCNFMIEDVVSGSVSHCYWNGAVTTGKGIGDDQSGSGGATQVDGTTVTWQTAVDAMNTALQNAGSEWRYELTGALPTLKKEE